MSENNILNVWMKREYRTIERAEGVYLYDDKGQSYLDASGGPVLVSLGHGRKDVAEALKKQAETVAFAYRFDFTNNPLKEATRKLTEASDGHLQKHFFVSGGSEATEVAVKLARVYQIDKGNKDKHKIIARWQSYHGNTMGALSWSGHTFRRKLYEPYLCQTPHIPPAYCYRCPYGKKPESCGLECAEALETEILVQGPESVAAFMMEPLSGSSLYAAFPKAAYFQRVREICDKYDVLLIFDEVMCGVGRTGKYFAYQHFGVKPDIVAMGKALSGGYFPIGSASCSQEVYDVIYNNSAAFVVGYSWVGNPLGASVVSKTLDILKEEQLVKECAEKGDYLQEKLKELDHPTIGEVRGLGTMIGVELVKDKKTKEPFPKSTGYAFKVAEEALNNGMFVEGCAGSDKGQAGDGMLFGPPFTISYAELDEIVDKFDKALTAAEREQGIQT